MSEIHQIRLRVYYEDTDLAGVVYYANYLRFIERARSEWVRTLGIDQASLRRDGIVFVVRRVEADYLSPARYDDVLDIETRVTEARRASFTVSQRVLREGEPLFEGLITIAAMNAEHGRPVRLPQALVAAQ